MTGEAGFLERSRTRDRPEQSTREETGQRDSQAMRMGQTALGVALVVVGLRRRSLDGVLAVVAGGWLLARSLGKDQGALSSRIPVGGRPTGRSGTTASTVASRSITVGKPPDEVYEAWRDPDEFSKVVGDFAEITAEDEDRLRWTVEGPRDHDVTWETRVVADEPGTHLRWKTTANAPITNEGSVRFRPAPGERGTVVTLELRFEPPGGALGREVLDRLDVVPEALASEMLRRFKRLVETGEIATLEGNPSARGAGDLL